MSDAKIGFQMQIFPLLLENILPVRQISEAQKKANRYEIILASIKAVVEQLQWQWCGGPGMSAGICAA